MASSKIFSDFGKSAGAVDRSSTFRVPDFLEYAIPSGIVVGILVRHLAFVPIWDGRQYFDALRDAVRQPFQLLNFNVFAHPSMLFMLWSSIGQFFDLGSAALLNGSQAVLAAVGVMAFVAVARKLLSEQRDRVERILLGAVFAVCPVVVASILSFSPDTGVMVALVAYLALFLRERFFAATLAALFLVSSKETGVLLYPVATALLLIPVWRNARSFGKCVRSAMGRTYMLAPMWFYLGVTVAAVLKGRSAFWIKPGSSGNRDLLRQFFVPKTTATWRAYQADIWVLNFHWILAVVIGVAVCGALVRVTRRRSVPLEGVNRQATVVVCSLFVLTEFLLTRVETHTNVRYLLPIFPLLFLVFGVALRLVFRSRAMRLGVLLILSILGAASTFRTLDPVSKNVYGTFRFGTHEILTMTSLTGECCGYGRDQLAYNLEFTRFATLQNRIYAGVHPRSSTVIACDDRAYWAIGGALDVRSFERTLRVGNTFEPWYATTTGVLFDPPKEFIYVEYPNVDNVLDLRALGQRFAVKGVRTYADAGYSIRVWQFVRKQPHI